jgi:hypothetical protein
MYIYANVLPNIHEFRLVSMSTNIPGHYFKIFKEVQSLHYTYKET